MQIKHSNRFVAMLAVFSLLNTPGYANLFANPARPLGTRTNSHGLWTSQALMLPGATEPQPMAQKTDDAMVIVIEKLKETIESANQQIRQKSPDKAIPIIENLITEPHIDQLPETQDQINLYKLLTSTIRMLPTSNLSLIIAKVQRLTDVSFRFYELGEWTDAARLAQEALQLAPKIMALDSNEYLTRMALASYSYSDAKFKIAMGSLGTYLDLVDSIRYLRISLKYTQKLGPSRAKEDALMC